MKYITWLPIIVLLFIIISIINTFLHFIPVPVDPIDKKSTKILFVDSSGLEVKTDEIKIHNQTLISILHNNMTLDVASYQGRENIKSQNRLLYAAIMAVLLSQLLLNDKKDFLIRIFLLLFIGSLYLVEIHRLDLDNRFNSGFDIKAIAIESLINSKSQTLWFQMKSDSLNAQMNQSNIWTERYPRKLQRAFNPDLEQIVFYLFPWVGVYILPQLLVLKRGKNHTNK